MNLLKITFSILFFFIVLGGHAQIVINEYSASNMNEHPDSFQKFEDWIELYNTSDETVNLEGWFLSDKEDNPTKWAFPEGIEIEANGFVLVWCSGRDLVNGNDIHTSYKLTQTKDNEFVVLSQPDGTLVESQELELTLLGHSRCKSTDGASDWKVCTSPTLNASNNEAPQFDGYTSEPTIVLDAGFYEGSQTVNIINNEPNSVMRYSLDGNAPTEDSPIYSGPIEVAETRVVKALSFSDTTAILPGKIAYNTYFIDETFTLPVFSVAADRVQDLANGEGELRPIGSVEYFDPAKDVYARSYGELNRHGQDSWVNPHRSLDFVCRDEMGYTKAIQAELFNYSDREEHQRLMFRASGDDNYPAIQDDAHEGSCHVRDEYVHELALQGGMELDVRAVERIIVFLNGDYWGVYGLRERPVDHDYTKEYYDQDKFNLQYLATWGDTWAEYGGDQAFEDWGIIRDFVLDNDMSDSSNYQVVKDNIKLVSLIDYMIANLNSVASDWLNYNTGWWRGLNPDGDHKKWGYILWDNDATFDYYINYSGVPNTQPDAVPCDIDDISEYMDEFFGSYWGGGDVGKHEKIFLKLQEESPEFRQLYYSRQADLMNTVYTCENMLNTLDSMIATIAPEMPRHIDRWGRSVEEWEENVQRLRGFIEQRCTLLDDGMVECFDVTGPYNLTLMVEPQGVGEIDLNTLDIENFPWSGNYFGGMENLIKARAFDDEVFEFVRWESKTGNTIFPDEFSRRASITLTQPDTLIAYFGLASSTKDLASNVKFQVFPNPTFGNLTVNYELEEAADLQLDLYSVIGDKISTITEINGSSAAGRFVKQIDLTKYNLAPGLYFLNFKADNTQKTVKVTIAK